MRALFLLVLLALAACGSKSRSARAPDDKRCNVGEYFLPGCSDEPGIVAGCYERCPFNSACEPAHTCTKVTVMPACAVDDGADVACDACGEELELCLPGGV
jgi:hypothetical protein